MSALLYDLTTRSRALPFPQGEALMRQPMNAVNTALQRYDLALVLTGRSVWSLHDTTGRIARLLRSDTTWVLAVQPIHQERVLRALHDALDHALKG